MRAGPLKAVTLTTHWIWSIRFGKLAIATWGVSTMCCGHHKHHREGIVCHFSWVGNPWQKKLWVRTLHNRGDSKALASLKAHWVTGDDSRRLHLSESPEVVDNSKATSFSRPKRADAHMTSQKLWPHSQELQELKPDKIPARRRGSGHKDLHLASSYMWWIAAFSMEWHWIWQRNPRTGPMPSSFQYK